MLLVILLATSSTTLANGEIMDVMHKMQTYIHKLQLSVDADNVPLAGFYAHELEEQIEVLEHLGSYDGYPVGTMGGNALMKSLDDLEDAIDSGNRDEVDLAYEVLMYACNQCHQATNHGFIVVKRNHTNPYAQDFRRR